jgi:NitT/TauT family transport system substrate-binding protein
MNTPLKRLFRAARALAGGLTLMAVAAAPVQAMEKLKVGYNQWIGSAGVFIAMEKGLFKKHGVDVEFTEFAGPGDGMTAVLAGHLDGVMTTTDNVILIADKAGPGKVVQVYFTDTSAGADAIIAKKELKSVADLKGKTVAATVGQVNHLLLLQALHDNGLKESDIHLVNMDAEAAGAAFMAGQIDAAVTWEPWLTKGRQHGGNIVFSSADAPNLILDTFAVNASVLKNKPEAVAAYIKAVDEGNTMLKDDPEAALKLVAKKLSTSVEDAKVMLDGVKMYGLADNKKLFAGSELTDATQEVADFLHDREIAQTKVKAPTLFEAGPVDSVSAK